MVPQTRILVLSNKDSIVESVRLAGAGASVIGVTCLKEPAVSGQEGLLVIDPGAVLPCCFNTLREWSRRRPERDLLYLTLPAPPSILFALPQVHPGRITDLGGVGALLQRDHLATLKRAAWDDVERLVRPRSGDEREQRFLRLARARHRRNLTVAQAAGALEVGSRHLTRLVWRWSGYSPHVVLELFRVECLTQDLRMTAMKLKDLAFMHGYASRRAMSRQFRAYTGTTPEVYRLSIHEQQAGQGRGARARGAASLLASGPRVGLTQGDPVSACARGEDRGSLGESAGKPGTPVDETGSFGH